MDSKIQERCAAAPKKPALNPKAIIHQSFDNKASYTVEEVKESSKTECPGLSIQRKAPCLYRCTLQLPELSVVSGTFSKKKDAEQSAAEMAIEKLGIRPVVDDPTPQEAWGSLIARVSYIFSENFLSSLHPLSSHIGAALWRKGDLRGSIPISVVAVYDAKMGNLCKCINPEVESNPLLVISFIMKATAELSGSLVTSEQHLWIRNQNPFSQDIVESLTKQDYSQECIQVAAIRIPSSVEKSVEAVTLHISPKEYYLDIIANELGFEDAANVLISRNLGRASSETRLFFAAPKSYLLDQSSNFPNGKETHHSEGSLNVRASYLSGQDIIGDAILASIGYTWKSRDLSYEDVTVRSYYRMLIGKTPGGIYKLSREAMLTAELPSRFTTRANWQGSLPRDILNIFCRQHHLSEPVFSVHPSKAVSESEMFKCELKILSKHDDLIIKCFPEDSFKKQNDAIQNASLKLLSWLNKYFKNILVPFEKLDETVVDFDIQIYSRYIFRGISARQSLHNDQLNAIELHKILESICANSSYIISGNGVCSLKIGGPDSGVCPCNGSLACISYSVSLIGEGENIKEMIEVHNDFEFEVGVGAVISYVEEVVMQMSVGQSACFTTNLLPDFIFASASDSVKMMSLLSSKTCCMEYEISLTKVAEPMEDRMEQALFSPSLSKQRVEFAVRRILESHATTLLDFGCGSGSLLEALLNYSTSLEKIAGVDISQKGLIRAAKVLNSKLVTNSDAAVLPTSVKSVILYEGSITKFGSRLHGFDIGTCLEVIEHMDEDQARLFGDVALSYFCPRILVVSTPNFEYNAVIQKSSMTNQEQEDKSDEKSLLQSCKFRNHDHKFEWTREQFQQWASDMAARHNYNVEFSGVGGSADIEPGFASQIAVFEREWTPEDNNMVKEVDIEYPYTVLWEWNSQNK